MAMLVGLDLGTTGCRCIIFDDELNIRGEAYYEYPLYTAPDGAVEQDAETWWRLTCRVLREAAEKGGVNLREVAALSISSQGITVVPVDVEMRPLCNAINWLDRRPGMDGGEILATLGAARYSAITARLNPDRYGLARLLWLRKNRPEVMARAHQVLMPMDFIIAKFCGKAVTDHSMAAGMACYDINARGWSQEILDAAGVDVSLLAPIAESGSVGGKINAAAAAECGLAEGTPIVVGAQDQKCGGVGAGLADGIATVSLGTSMAMLSKVDRVTYDPKLYIPCFSDLFGDGYMLESVLGVGAGCLKWYHDTYYPDKSYKHVVDLAETHEPTLASPFFHPHLQGHGTPRSGACTGSFTGLTLDTGAAALAHALLEGVSFGLRENVDAVLQTSGCAIQRLRVHGGGSKDRYWLQQIADICNLPVESLYTHEMPCGGAAILAGIGAGIYHSPADGQRFSVRVKDTCLPNPARHAVYTERYQAYLEVDRRICAL